MDESVSSQRASLNEETEELVVARAETEAPQDETLWTAFAEATTVDAFCRSWLALQCRLIGSVSAGLVLLGPPDRGPFSAVAVWPDHLAQF